MSLRELKTAQELRQALASGIGYSEQFAALQALKRLKPKGLTPVKFAVLGSSTTAQLVPLLRLHLFKEGFDAEIYESDFGVYQQEILDPASRLYRFEPRVALLYVHYRDIQPGGAEKEAARWTQLCKTLQERAGCAVIVNNFDSPAERPLGNLEARREDGRLSRIRKLNSALAAGLPPGVFLLDQEHLSSTIGKERWFDARYWFDAKMAISPEALPRYAAEAAALSRAILGRSRKCLALDLDNTLWGGVVGDDGVGGLELGHTPRGEAFVEFQRYLKALKDRGVLLAVCSKNDEKIAREAFSRPEMVLKLEDFAAFVANWDDKAKNLKAIAAALNIGLDAVAFADDNPAECELVRRLRPEVAVVALPEDSADFVRALDATRLFEPVTISSEDAARAAHFEAERARAELQKSAADLGGFLRDLKMEAHAEPFSDENLERVVQLIGKTNQFNLTTRRHGEAQARKFMKDKDCVTLAVRLKDRLGDYGLISVLIAGKKGDALDIDTWLLSCRAFSRTVEQWTFNRLLERAKAMKVKTFTGTYLPTAKNGIVKDFFAKLGFKPALGGRWTLDVKSAKPVQDFIGRRSGK